MLTAVASAEHVARESLHLVVIESLHLVVTLQPEVVEDVLRHKCCHVQTALHNTNS